MDRYVITIALRWACPRPRLSSPEQCADLLAHRDRLTGELFGSVAVLTVASKP
jgi:hypothetical protein